MLRGVLAATLVLTAASVSWAGADLESSSRTTMIIAHRGVSKLAPENTLPAIQRAIEMGLDFVEMDVRLTKDGRMVLMHDETVDRTTDGTGRVRDLTAEEIAALDAGSWFSPEFAGTRVPFLEEALELMRGRIGAYVDLKAAPPRRLLAALEEADMLGRSAIYAGPGMQWRILELDPDAYVMPEVGPSIRIFDLMDGWLAPAVVAVSWGMPTRAFVRHVHAQGVLIFMDVPGDMDDADGMRALIELGIDGLQTDHPDILLEVVGDGRRSPRAR